jgi:uncharacterized protein DUF4242
VSDDADLRLFLVEHNLRGLPPEQQASAHRAVTEAVLREASHGRRIRYVQRIFVPADGRCLCLFAAESPDAVRAVNDIAQFPLTAIVAVTSTAGLTPDPGRTAQ